MATKKAEVKELEQFEGVKEFKATNVSKHLVEGQLYELNYEMAKLLFEKGYIEC